MRKTHIILLLCFLISVGCQERDIDMKVKAQPVDVNADQITFKSSGGTTSRAPEGTTIRLMVFDVNNVNLVIGEDTSMSDKADGTGTYILSGADTRTFRPCQLDNDGQPVLVDGKWNEDKKYSLRLTMENTTNHAVLVSPGRMFNQKADGTGRVIFPLDASNPDDHNFYVSSTVPVTVSDYRIYLSGTSMSPVFSKVKVNIRQSEEKQEQQAYEIKDKTLILKNTSQKGDYYPNLQTVDFYEDSYDVQMNHDAVDEVWSTGDIYLFAGDYTPGGLGSLGISFTLLVHAEDDEGNAVTAEMPVNMSISQILNRAGYYVYDVIWTSESVILRLTTKDWANEDSNDIVVDGNAKTQIVGEWRFDGNWINGGGGSTEI